MGKEDVMFSPQSFYGRESSRHLIEAMEKGIVASITHDQLQAIYDAHPRFERTGRLLTQKYYLLSLNNFELLATGTVRERYEHFLQTYPGMEGRIPTRHIASFLKCTPRSIQRLRKDQGLPQ